MIYSGCFFLWSRADVNTPRAEFLITHHWGDSAQGAEIVFWLTTF